MTEPGKLDRESAHPARRAVNNYLLISLQLQHIIDSLQRGEPGDWDCAGMKGIQSFGNPRDFLLGNRNVFGIESPLRIGPAVGVDAVLEIESMTSRAHRNDRAGTVIAQHVGKLYAAARRPAAANIGIP